MDYVEKEISLDYQFNLPSIIDVVHYGGKILVIAREEGNWIVLDNENQRCFFDALCEQTIEEALESTNCPEDDATIVVTQLVARHFERKVRYQRVLPIMQLYLTNSCNMRCPHCYMYAGEKLEKEMTTEEIKTVMSAYRNAGGRDIKVTGGEIALRPDLIEIISYGHEIGLRIDLLTNGTLWSDNMIEEVKGLVHSVQISVDGYDEEENSKIRGSGNFAKALNAVDKFLRAGVRVQVAITAYYSDDINTKVDKYAEFATSLKQKYENYKFDVEIATGLLPGRFGKLSAEQAQIYEDATMEVNNKYKGCSDIKNLAYIKRHRSGVVLTNCSFGFPTIAANGDLHFCPVTVRTSPVANIRTTPLNEVMEMCKKAHEYSDTRNLEPCSHCDLKAICGGDCRLNFPELKSSDLKKMEKPHRECSQSIKEYFYKIMLETNEDIFF